MARKPVTTLYDYQLAMLHPMHKSAPAQAAALLDRIGATRIDTAISEKRWFYGEAVNNFKSIDEYVTAWGAPTSERIEQVESGHKVRYAAWNLTFWPELQVEFMEIRRGHHIFKNLLRRPELPRPPIESVADLTPWSCTYSELQESSLAPIDHVDGFGAVGDVVAFAATDPDTGRQQHYFAYIDWALLQSVEPAPGWYSPNNDSPT
ncbi:hypothetical protein LTV02_16220 [Nocardia yamanashiensis]|uniref:hypothetical protein n=1 Tax=Nocardia yamanashiensis TaxID=209247 RepID=UPI001E5087D2|nr:hypothetical protein [Nocardia yamanashiensis]UGT44842.1 hypothetical protein LTV02_16220 [Nocardia yamanashiensis]